MPFSSLARRYGLMVFWAAFAALTLRAGHADRAPRTDTLDSVVARRLYNERTHSAANLCILLCCVVLTAGCATRPTVSPARSWAEPCDTCIAGVANFAKVSPRLWRGSQPTQTGFHNLEKAGVKTILSLRGLDDLPLLGGTKLKYLCIPMYPWAPDEAQVVLFLEVVESALRDADSWPVFVHCAAGQDRTGYSIAAHRMVLERWTAGDAIHEMFDFGFNAVWSQNPAFLQRLDVERIRALIMHAP
jgi:hypothetical protein